MIEILVSLIGAQSAVLVALIQRASKRADRAVQQTRETGNGHAGRVESALSDIRRDLSDIRRDHSGLRSEIRAERERLRSVDDRLMRIEVKHGKANQEPD